MGRTIEVDEDVYRFLVKNTRELGESASDILRRLLDIPTAEPAEEPVAAGAESGEGDPAARDAEQPSESEPRESADAPKAPSAGKDAPKESRDPEAPTGREAAKPPGTGKDADAGKGGTSGKEVQPGKDTASGPKKDTTSGNDPEPARTAEPAPPPRGKKKKKKKSRSPQAESPAGKNESPQPRKTESRPDPKPAPAEKDVPNAALADFLESPVIRKATGSTRYLEILGFLAQQHPDAFEKIFGMSGRPGRYFAKTKREVEESGRSTRPQQIPHTTFWALGDLDDFQRRDILKEAMELMRCDPEAVRMCVAAIR